MLNYTLEEDFYHKENAIMLKHNVAIARNYQLLSWYLNMFKQLETKNKDVGLPKGAKLSLVLHQAKSQLNLKTKEIDNV
jgi:hypothetical protein